MKRYVRYEEEDEVDILYKKILKLLKQNNIAIYKSRKDDYGWDIYVDTNSVNLSLISPESDSFLKIDKKKYVNDINNVYELLQNKFKNVKLVGSSTIKSSFKIGYQKIIVKL